MSYTPNTEADRREMLSGAGVSSVDELFPKEAKAASAPDLPPPLSEPELMEHLESLSGRNKAGLVSFLGGGSYRHYVPSVVKHLTGRSEFYTSYTPYQPELSQGVLQAIYEFQSMICSLTGMDAANASMYDGGSSAAEAVSLACRFTGKGKALVSSALHPNYRAVVKTYGQFSGWTAEDIPLSPSGIIDMKAALSAIDDDTACAIVSQPNFFGCIEEELGELADALHKRGALMIVSVDPLSLGILKPPADCGADIVTGEAGYLGSPLSFGGPGLGIFAAKGDLLRFMPGRLSGATTDSQGRRGFVLTLQTREQHIRRERAGSNICTNEALNALATTAYLSAMGRRGLREAAEHCLQKANYARRVLGGLKGYGIPFRAKVFKEFVLSMPVSPEKANRALLKKGFVGGLPLKNPAGSSLVCVTELTKKSDIDAFSEALKGLK